MSNLAKKKGIGGFAFLPILSFLIIYIGAGIYFTIKGVDFAFYQFPAFGSSLIAILVGFLLTREKLSKKFDVFVSGIANNGVATMLIIYIFAGAFSGVTAAMGGRDATVNLGLSVIPVQFLAAGVFIIAALMGTATGTSIGTITAIAPIAIGIAAKGGLNVGIVVGACVGGAMFGDNLSMISDTTIAATSTQGVQLKDKFRVNLMIALPAAIVTLILLLIFGRPQEIIPIEGLSYNIVKVIPYLVVFVLAILGLNVLVVLIAGILSATIIGIALGTFTFIEAGQAMFSGVTGMDEIFYLTLLMAGVAALVQHYGGVEWLIRKATVDVKGNKGAQLFIAFIASILDLATATNTVAIILSGDLAKNISKEYKIDPRRTASLLDIFSCVFQGLLPYSGQLLLSSAFALGMGLGYSPVNFIPYVWYCFLLALFGILSIFIPFADGYIKKHPWNWEQDAKNDSEQGAEL